MRLERVWCKIQLNNRTVNDYIDKTVRIWLGLRADQDIIIPTMPECLKQLFLRAEEYKNPHRDQWGIWEHSFSSNYQNGKMWIPEVNLWYKEIKDQLVHSGVSLLPLWPENKRFAVVLTHDVDLISDQFTARQYIRNIWNFISSSEVSNMQKKDLNLLLKHLRSVILRKLVLHCTTEKTIDKMVKIDKKFNVTSSFFFSIWPVGKNSIYDCIYSMANHCIFMGKPMKVFEMLRILHQEGFDVGLHGSYYSAIEEDQLQQQKITLEENVGFDVTTTRQHFLNWDIRKTPRLQCKAGFLADSTLGFNRNIGFRSGVALPYRFFDLDNRNELPILQVPLIIQDGALFTNNALELNRKMARDVLKTLIDRVSATEGCIAFLFHPHGFNSDREYVYAWAIEYCLAKKGWITSLRGMYDWC